MYVNLLAVVRKCMLVDVLVNYFRKENVLIVSYFTGTAFTSLQGRTLYPALSSTAAKSAMKVIYSSSFPSTLQLLCLKSVSSNSEMMKILKTIPHLKSQIENEYWWLTPPEGSAGKFSGKNWGKWGIFSTVRNSIILEPFLLFSIFSLIKFLIKL